jgi:hypothetical protein
LERKWRDRPCGQEEESQYRWRMKATCYGFSGVARLESYFPLESILRLMEGMAGQEGYCSEDLLLWFVVWKG